MSKKFKSQASSSRAASGAFGSGTFGGFSSASTQQEGAASSLSWISEPPDLSQIYDPQVVVAFKNLLKKDSRTKSKALEDLQGFFSTYKAEGGTPEDGLLEAWTSLYPRTSIDSSRRVRQLAHNAQGDIVSVAGKRIARHIPKVVGAWLAGLYDNDKLAQRAAEGSIITAFSTEEKRQGIWKVYQSSILDFVVDAVLRQTPQTLSDERTVRPDELEGKHARVVASGIQVFKTLLAAVGARNLSREPIETLLGSRTLWKFAHHDDPFVRRSLYELLNTLLAVDEESIDWKLMSTSILSKSLSISQRGSAPGFSALLLNITRRHPQVWTTDYSGKTSPAKRLLQYIKRGSEGASHLYWDNLYHIFRGIPDEILLPQTEDAKGSVQSAVSLLMAFHEGILHREEPRTNLGVAWSAYLDTALWISTLISDRADRLQLLRDYFCPVLIQYVLVDPENSQWTIKAFDSRNICADRIIAVANSDNSEVLHSMWQSLTGSLDQGLKCSSPEQSQGYKTSQDAICIQANRLFDLEAEVLQKAATSSGLDVVRSIFRDTTVHLLRVSADLLRSRNGKPYGAAAMVSEAAIKVPEFVGQMDRLDDILSQDVPNLIFSPSADRLVSALFHCRDQKGFQSSLHQSIDSLFDADPETLTTLGLRKLFSFVSSQDIRSHEKIESLATNRLKVALQGCREAWTDVIVLLQNPASHDTVAPRLLRCVLDYMSLEDMEALYGLNRIISESKEPVQTFVTGANGPKLISKLLYIAESPVDEISHLADSLEVKVKGLINREDSSNSTVEIVQHSFRDVGQDSLSLDSLVTISEELLLKTPSGDRPRVLSQLLPTAKQWAASLHPFLNIPPKHSSSITSPLGGSVYLANKSSSESARLKAKSAPRDASLFPLSYRLSFYVTKLLSAQTLEDIGAESRHALFMYLPVAIQLIDDDLNIEKSTSILSLEHPEVRDECAELVSDARRLIHEWLQATSGPHAHDKLPSIASFWEQQLPNLKDDAPEIYRMADVAVRVVSERDAIGRISSAESALQLAEQTSATSSPFALPACLAAYRTSLMGTASCLKLCNRLVADLTSLETLTENEGLRKVIALNILIQGENSLVQKVPTQRLVFFVKHLIQCLESKELSLALTSECFKTLATVFPFIKDIYGSHWSEILEIIESSWESGEATEENLPVLHSSFRLFACLRSLATSESNDDLEDAWIAAQKSHPEKLINLLTEFDQSFCPDLPWNITTDLLARQISNVSVDHVEDVSNVFSALSVQNRGVQRGAYNVLRRAIPKSQEAVSFNLALSDIPVNLPDELISLLVETPTMGTLSQRPAHDSLWIEVRTFLLSWKAVFDHFEHASLPVRVRYSANIKEHECLPPLLDFTFGFLQDQRDKPIDASKFAIRTLELDQSESAEKETQWLLVHLYYLCLRYLPNLTKAWWMDSKKRVKGPIETWTEKFISPLIIEDSLNDVSTWFASQDQSNEEQPLQIKVSHRAAEIVASIEVDAESPPTALAISLPSTYPLQQATVTGRHRVAVDEKKWKNWLLTIQGVIMFSNGNLVDALLAFRRNVQGALKGQGECTICYSVISADMQTPNKRCATCKQTFHSDCLFRWFRTSNSSACPLCRNNFLYS